MVVEQVKDVTTRDSAISYQVTLRITCLDLAQRNEDAFGKELKTSVVKAINGIAQYPYFID